MLIIRCFRRNNPLSYITLLRILAKFSKVQPLLVEFEFASFGNFATAGFLPLFLSIAKILGKHMTIVVHQVVTDLAALSGHIGVAKYTQKLTILNNLMQLYYQLLGGVAHTIIVLEEHLKERLAAFVNEDKIIVIPHGVHEPKKRYTTRAARVALGISRDEIVLLYFGYITWYKGADLLVKALQKVKTIHGKKVRVILAGGMTPTQKEKSHYQAFFNKVNRLTQATKHIAITGFVAEKDIAKYYAAADVVLLPYRTFMSSSGPLALSLAYNKPFLVSKALQEVVEVPDMQEVLSANGLQTNDMLFSLQAKQMRRAITRALKKITYQKLQKATSLLAQKRAYDVLATHYAAVIAPQEDKHILVTPAVNS